MLNGLSVGTRPTASFLFSFLYAYLRAGFVSKCRNVFRLGGGGGEGCAQLAAPSSLFD